MSKLKPQIFLYRRHRRSTSAMAVTHADLAPSRRSTDLGSKTGAFIIVLSMLFGLLCFSLCLIAEAFRSEVTWVSSSDNGEGNECTYSGSGKTPLLCSAGAFFALAIAMVVAHAYMMVAVTKSPPPALVAWDPDSSGAAKTLTWQAGFFFITTWISFAVGEILLLIGITVESGHLKDWSTPKNSCLIIQQGLFSAAGVCGLATVFLVSGLYVTALRAQWLGQGQENVRREVLETSALHSSPPRSPSRRITTVANENPIVVAGNQNHQQPLSEYLSTFNKHSSLV